MNHYWLLRINSELKNKNLNPDFHQVPYIKIVEDIGILWHGQVLVQAHFKLGSQGSAAQEQAREEDHDYSFWQILPGKQGKEITSKIWKAFL